MLAEFRQLPPRIQTLVAKSPVETFDESVLSTVMLSGKRLRSWHAPSSARAPFSPMIASLFRP
jgi:hypothetical protein